MAIQNYNELAAAVAAWLARGDLADRIPGFIALAEAAFNREFRVRAMEQRATAATVAGLATPANVTALPLPADCAAAFFAAAA